MELWEGVGAPLKIVVLHGDHIGELINAGWVIFHTFLRLFFVSHHFPYLFYKEKKRRFSGSSAQLAVIWPPTGRETKCGLSVLTLERWVPLAHLFTRDGQLRILLVAPYLYYFY